MSGINFLVIMHRGWRMVVEDKSIKITLGGRCLSMVMEITEKGVVVVE